MACGSLVPWPGVEPVPTAVEVPSPNHMTARELPVFKFLIDSVFYLLMQGSLTPGPWVKLYILLPIIPHACITAWALLHHLHPTVREEFTKLVPRSLGTALLMCMGKWTELTVWPGVCYFDYTIASVFFTCAVEYIIDLFIHEEHVWSCGAHLVLEYRSIWQNPGFVLDRIAVLTSFGSLDHKSATFFSSQ